ncbi:hypothetical protein [Streptomyces sp. NPDC007100]|uniref:hypothetical protein n=1 Tax=unclassified Streptomyces TaxID=2593676 RepID=UPI0033FFCC5B
MSCIKRTLVTLAFTAAVAGAAAVPAVASDGHTPNSPARIGAPDTNRPIPATVTPDTNRPDTGDSAVVLDTNRPDTGSVAVPLDTNRP